MCILTSAPPDAGAEEIPGKISAAKRQQRSLRHCWRAGGQEGAATRSTTVCITLPDQLCTRESASYRHMLHRCGGMQWARLLAG